MASVVVFNPETSLYEKSFSYGDGLVSVPDSETIFMLNAAANLARSWGEDSFHAKQLQTILNQVA